MACPIHKCHNLAPIVNSPKFVLAPIHVEPKPCWLWILYPNKVGCSIWYGDFIKYINVPKQKKSIKKNKIVLDMF